MTAHLKYSLILKNKIKIKLVNGISKVKKKEEKKRRGAVGELKILLSLALVRRELKTA